MRAENSKCLEVYIKDSYPTQTAQDAKIRRFTIRKACSEQKAKGGTGQPFASAEEIRCATWPSQQKPGIEMRLSRKDLWRTLLSNGVNPWDMHG